MQDAVSLSPEDVLPSVILKYGLLGGAALSAMFAATLPFHEQIGMDYGMLIGYATMVVAFTCIYFGVRSYRDRQPTRTITFGHGVLVGGAIMLLASACYTATWEAWYFSGKSNFYAVYKAASLKKLEERGATAQELAAKNAEMEDFKVMYDNPLANAAITMLEPLPVGVVYILLSAAMLSRKPRGTGAASD